ncbi:response regulator [Bacillus sp. Bva_UNVM-123]|uniref:response regulator n=1 Tax=Bacillus sp. Bva_UNVM-123 TaxID=2829798 RepID=UPI00391F2E73
MRVLLIDDELLALDVLERQLIKMEGIDIVGKFQDPELAFQKIEKLEAEVIFLDMNMGDVHGIEYAEKITAIYSHIEIIFVTAYPEFALEAFEVNAIDYLLKPVRLDRLKKAVLKTEEKLALNKAKKDLTPQTAKTLYVYTMKSFRLIDSMQNVVKWRTKKVKELFVFLWHYRESPVHKDQIIEELWPEMDISKSMVLLHTTVYHLRKVLKENNVENPIKLVNECYILSVPFHSDIYELEEIVKSTEISSEYVKRVLEIYSGDYLEEENYAWAIKAQQRIRKSVLHALEKYVELEKYVDDQSPLLEASLEKMLALDIYNETYMYELLAHYGKMGSLQKLEELYELISERLINELGIIIPDKIEQLYKRLLKKMAR